MDIYHAEPSDAEYLVKELWRPMAREMEELSDFNELSDEGVAADATDYLTDRLSDSAHTVFIMEIDNRPVGFLALEIKAAQDFFERGLYGHVHELFVVEEYRRNGSASKLLERAEKYCKEKDCEMMQLSVNVRNDGAQKLYKKHDFDKERVKMVKEF